MVVLSLTAQIAVGCSRRDNGLFVAIGPGVDGKGWMHGRFRHPDEAPLQSRLPAGMAAWGK